MQTSSLVGTREHKRASIFIPYHPYLRDHFKNTTIPLLVSKLEYWFSHKKFYSGFFKFLEPCNNRLYREGDSWSEELTICRKTFNKLFEIIGTRYKSKSLFLLEEDPFKGKLYASYYDRKTNRMFYVRNHAYADTFFKEIKISKPSTLSSSLSNKLVSNSPESHSSNGKIFLSKERDSLDIYKQKNTNIFSSSTPPKLKVKEVKEENLKVSNYLLKIWEEFIGSIPSYLKAEGFLKKIKGIFENFFNGSIEKWKSYCKKISTSRFLMGEVNSFKILIQWAIKPEIINRILGNGFTFGDRISKPISFQDSEILLKKHRIEENFEKLPHLKKEVLRKVYLERVKEKSPGIAHTLFQEGWDHSLIKKFFNLFLYEIWDNGDYEKIIS